jgi:hypothetical protein
MVLGQLVCMHDESAGADGRDRHRSGGGSGVRFLGIDFGVHLREKSHVPLKAETQLPSLFVDGVMQGENVFEGPSVLVLDRRRQDDIEEHSLIAVGILVLTRTCRYHPQRADVLGRDPVS